MERWAGRVALVTGASAGIGAAVVRALVTGGMKVVGCARRIEKLQVRNCDSDFDPKLTSITCALKAALCLTTAVSPHMIPLSHTQTPDLRVYGRHDLPGRALKDELKDQPGSVFPIQCDLSREDQILAMFETIRTDPKLGGVDVCVNNAAMAKDAPLLSGHTAHWRTMLDVNVLALSICTREAVKSMKSRGVDDGYIFIIGSMSGHRLTNNGAVHFYSATKFAVRALTEGIRNELREMKSHIRVTAISPGVVETEFAYQMYPDTPEKAKAFYSSLQCIKAEDIASQLVFALQSPPHVQIHDFLVRPTEQIP